MGPAVAILAIWKHGLHSGDQCQVVHQKKTNASWEEDPAVSHVLLD